MRGLNILLTKIGLTFAQQQNVLRLLIRTGCYEEQILREDLNNAGYDESFIDELVKTNPHLVHMDEIDEAEQKKLLQWLSIASKRAAQQQENLPINVYQEIYDVTIDLSTSLHVTSHTKYDAALILGQNQEDLLTQSKMAKRFLKEKHIAVTTVFTPNNPGDTQANLAECIDSIKNQLEYANKANVSNIYKFSYFIAKTNRLLIITSQQQLENDTKIMQEFFTNNQTWLSAEIICINTPQFTAKKLLEQIHQACSQVTFEKTKPVSSYYAKPYLGLYGALKNSYNYLSSEKTEQPAFTTSKYWSPTFRN